MMDMGIGEIGMRIVEMLVVAGAAYGAIKSDIRGLHRDLKTVEKTADKAHDRLDRHLEGHA